MKTITHSAGNWLLATKNYALLFGLILAICTAVFAAEPNQQWVARYNGPVSSYDSTNTNALAIDNLGNVYVTGHSDAFGGGANYDYATIKYSPDGNQLWVARYNGPGHGYDWPYALALDNSGNVYVTGESVGSGTNYDYATIKYSSDGNQLWVRRYNGLSNSSDIAYALAVDNSGNVYVTGGSDSNYVTVKYNTDGNQLWVKSYNGPANSSDYANALAVDNSGNVYVTGWSTGSGTGYDYATIKYDTNGNQLWAQRYNGDANKDDLTYAISVDNSGNVYVTGGSEVTGTDYDYITVKYKPDGNKSWVARYAGPGNSYDFPQDMAVDNSGNVYVTGYSGGSGTSSDYATIKYNPDGNQLWVARYNNPGVYNSDFAYALTIDNAGNVYVTGESSASDSYHPDCVTIKYSPDGNQLWIERYNGPGDSNDTAHSIAVDNSGNVYISGDTWSESTREDYVTIKYTQQHYYVIYVDANATGANNGTSWANAYKYLQNALWAATSGYEVWVAQGTYKPDRDINHPSGTGSRTATFQLKNNVAIYGGFPSGGGTWANRDPNAHQTILSGDLSGNDANVSDPCNLLTEPTRAENSYHVITGSNTDATAILDGFTIRAGNASSGSWPDYFGGGMFNLYANCTVNNCIFTENSSGNGGVMHNNQSNLYISNCIFFRNSASGNGGGIDFYQSNHPTLTNCTFNGNSAPVCGGGVNNTQSNTEMNNCIFIGNVSSNGGGLSNVQSNADVSKCSFSNNTAHSGGGGGGGGGISNINGSSTTITDCNFISNSAVYGGGINDWNSTSTTLTNCTFTGNSATYLGGGMKIDTNCYAMLTKCNFIGNTSGTGKGLYSYETSVINLGIGGNIFTSDEFYVGGSSEVQGTGSIIIGLGGEMVIDVNAIVDLSDPCYPGATGTIQCDGLLKVKQNAILQNADVNISQQPGGVYGKFAVEDSAAVINLNIFTDGDRYMDVDPCTFTGFIEDNRIYVTITEGQNGSSEGILEVRGRDLPSHPCDFNNPNTLACQIDDVNMPDFNTASWTLERLTVAPGAKVTLMDRFSSGNGIPEVLYVRDLNLGVGCVLNVGSQYLYYTICSGDMNSIRKETQLGFSLGVIYSDSNEEFQSRVNSNNYINPTDPNSSRIYVERVVGLEPDPNGMMKMQSLEDANGQMISARAKGEFAPADENEIRIRFNYLFNDPCGQIVVYLSDVPELLDPCDPYRDAHYIEVGRVFAPPWPMPGSAGSNRFGNFDKFVSTDGLDLSKGTWIELELIVPGGSGPLFARGSAKQMHIMDSGGGGAGVYIDDWAAGVSCSSTCWMWDVCRDLTSDCYVLPADFLRVVSGIGTTDTPSCVDGTLSADGYTDSYDTVSWDWMLEAGQAEQCGEVPLRFGGGGGFASSGGFGAFGGEIGLLDLADLNDLLIEGKRGGASPDVKLQDRLYIFNSDPCYIKPIELAPDDRCNIRIVRGAGSDFYRINSEQGLLHLETGVPIISPGQVTCEINEPRYNLHATVYAGIQAGGSPYGRPILDAAFDTAGFVYVVPVVVVPITNEPNTYTAAAKIQLNPYRVVKLYDGPLLAYDYAHPEYQLQYRNNLREIELDDACNVYLTNANAHNESDILWKFEPNGAVVRLNLDLSNPPVRAPTGLCVSSATNRIYVASSIHNDMDPNSAIICGFSTTTLSLTPARTITVRKMQRITSIAEDPVTGTLWVTGLSFNAFPDGYEIEQYYQNASPFYDPNLAKVPLGQNDVNAVSTLIAGDLAMPLSICWTGARLPPELCGGADLNKNGTVNMLDFALFAGYWRHTDCTSQNNYCDGADLEPQVFPDGDVDLMDLAVLAEHWLDTGCQ